MQTAGRCLLTVSVELALHGMSTNGTETDPHGTRDTGEGAEHVVDHLEVSILGTIEIRVVGVI